MVDLLAYFLLQRTKYVQNFIADNRKVVTDKITEMKEILKNLYGESYSN